MKRLRGKKGFTLVEMVVTLTIVGILLAGSVMGVGAYIDYSNFRSNNDCAYSLFMTIQSALAQQKASGELERIKNTYTFTSIPLPDSGGEKTGRSVQYIIIANGELASTDGQAFLDIVGDYIYDKSLLNASILVELDLTEGTVYSVAYSKQAVGLSYDSDNTSDQSGEVSIKFGNRERSIRRGTLLGYYSSDLPDSAPSSLGRPSISYVMLKNGETLDLGWRMNGRYRGQLSSLLTYDITLKTASGDTAAFTLNENGIAIAAGSGNYDVKVTHDGSEQTVTLPFTVAVEADGIHVTLDMADLEAARQAELTAPGIPNYDNTESAMRLSALWGGYTGGISATVQARGITTAVSDAKTSATENLFLGTGNTIQNARHLFNLRFMGDTPSTFKQTASFAWGGTDGLLAHGKVANSRAVVTDRDTAFPSIAALAEGSTLEGAQNLKMDYLRFSDGGKSENGVALLRENYGTIKNVTFSNATVEAEDSDFVAAACGVNYGSLIGVSVDGNVTGRNYVGGVAGYDGSATGSDTEKILRSSLKNAAAVTGESYVGGIFGATVRPKSEAGESGILSCTNTGAIRSSKDEGRFIGGIAGLNSGRTIKECTSTPKGKLSDAKAADLKGDYVGGIVGLQTSGGIKNCNTNGGLVAGGNFVGGIVGLSTAGNLYGEGGHNRADVAGKKYVGGITGANVKAAVTLTTEQKTITGATEGKLFTVATVEKSGVTETDGVVTGWEEYNSENTVRNWTNEGIVTANGSYAGGITGFNAGKIAECSANVNVSTTSGKNRLDALTALADANKLGRLADFVGGIAGANVNEIAAPAGNARFVCVAAGRDYVGGIVGYNAAGGSVTGFAVSDAYISGRCFVGGFMGLNCAAGVYGTGNIINTIEAHPSLIEGEYFVGGIMGGSIIASDDQVTLHCTVNNFQGNITSETGAAVGGLIGYNAMLEESSSDDTQPQCLALAKKLTDKLEDWRTVHMSPTGYNSAAIEKEALQRVTRVLMNDMDGMSTDEDDDDPPRLRDNLPKGSEAAFTIEPIPNETPNELRIEFSSIKGYLYAGGAIGYNCINTKLNAKNIVNLSNVTAEGMVEEGGPDDAKKGKGEHDESAVTFSYAGGIIGRVTQFMRVENCSNDASIRVRGNGTYTGLLAEVNEGVITDCTTIGVSSSGSNALGGIAGLNRFIKYGDNTANTSGYIVNCKLTGDLKGGKNVGGIAAVNMGLIENCEVGSASGVTIEGGGAVGAIAARNDGTIKSCKVIADAIIGENNVGGIAGENGGSIEACTIAADTPIRGEENVGGFAGYQRVASSTNIVSNLKNEAAVSGSNYVGGIIGRIDGAVTVENCTNTKPISAAAANGYAGGILAYNGADGVIKDCQNTADVSAPQGNAGGIAAYNAGRVENCTASGTEAQPLNITAGKNAGGIAGIVGPEDKSSGRVSGCTLENVKVTGVANADGANVGGVAGLNNGTVGPASAENLSVTGAASGGAIGGVAGKNRGSITGDAVARTPFNATVTLGSGLEGYIGGIAGWNLGTVQNYTFAGKVAAPGSALYGYGGVVGVNGDPNSAQMATIVNCSVNSAVKYKNETNKLNDWDLEDVVGGNTEAGDAECTVVTTVKANVCVGGIAGLNCQYSTVSASTLESCYIRGYYGYVGGIVGLNKGDVTDCVAANATDSGIKNQNKSTDASSANYGFKVKVYMLSGDAGGIVGRTTRTAVVKDCKTGYDWTVLVYKSKNSSSVGVDDTCAGIIGYNCTDKDLSGLENYARVRKHAVGDDKYVAGGIMGRQENITSSTWKISDCINYGNVEASKRVGGVIGQWKYNGGTLENCQNYGYICSANKNGDGSGGIVGDTLGITSSQRYNITSCLNHGDIRATDGNEGGIVGRAINQNSNATIIILDCVNTGNAPDGGILGRQTDTKAQVNINRCINYYNNATGNAMVGSGAANVSNSICVPEKDDNTAIGGNGTKLNNFRLLHGAADDSGTDAKLIKMGVIPNTDKATFSEYSYTAEGKAGDKSYKITPGLKLDPNADENKDKPYGNYLAINDQLKKFIEEQFKGDVKSPDTVTVTTSGGAYLAKWTGSDNAYQYDVKVEIGSEVGGSFTLYPDASTPREYTYTVFENRLSFAVDSVFENKGLKLRVTVTASNGEGGKTSTPVLHDVLNPLLMPKVQYEFTYEGATPSLKVRARLLNYGDYSDGTIDIRSWFTGGTEYKKNFSVADRQSAPFDFTKDAVTGVAMSAEASGDKYIISPVFSMQTQQRSITTMSTGGQLSKLTNDPYLTGIRPSELACKLSLQKDGVNNMILRRTELVVTDIGLGRAVEVVIGESHNDRIDSTHALTLNLTAPLAGGQSYTVRSYPWGTQGVADGAEGYISGCAYGHAVAENVQRASLTTLVDPWDTNAEPTKIYVDTPGSESLADGYVLSLNADGTYDVYYSALLHCKQDSGKECQFITKAMDPLAAVAAPVLSDVPTTENGYTVFTWTAAGQTAADIYEAKVTAITFDGAEVTVVVPANAIQHTPDGGTLSLDLSAGNYRSVSVTITRLGTADASGKTTKLGSESNTVSYAIPRALPAIGSPTVSIDSSNGRADVKYVVSWTPETGYARYDTAGYTLWLEEDAAQGSPVALATPTTLTPDTDTTTVDLEAYQGKQVRLYLTAHCKPSPDNYTQDSPAGAPTIRTVASRVKLNGGVALALTPAYAAATSVSVDSFNADALLSTVSALLVPPTDAATASGSFVMQAAILKTNNDQDPDTHAPADMTDAKLIAWDANSVGMTSSVPNSLSVPSTYSLADFDDFSEDYAAMWVCARVRAVSSSNDLSQFVSSHWTPYAWLRLPRVQLNVPHSATSAAKLPEFSATTTNNDVLPIVEETAEQELSQAALEWTWDKHANACTITIEGDSGDGSNSTYFILLERNEATGEFTATNTSGTTATPIAKDGASTALSPSFTWTRSANTDAPQYGRTLRYNDTTGRYLNVQTRLIVTTSEPDAEGNSVSTCKLVLPDYDQVTIGAITYDAPFCTKSVTLKYTPLEGDRYDESQELSWAWADTPNAETFAARGYVFGGIS